MILLALLGCSPDVGPGAKVSAAPPAAPSAATSPESDAPYAGTGRWELDGHVVTLEGGTLYGDGLPVLTHVYDAPVATPKMLWVPADPGEGDGGIYAVRVADGLVLANPILTVGRPERLALAPDGATLVFVSGASGITSLWSVPATLDTGVRPRQLTNVGLVRVPGQVPEGFVPPPDRAPVRFDGDGLVWESAGVERRAPWR